MLNNSVIVEFMSNNSGRKDCIVTFVVYFISILSYPILSYPILPYPLHSILFYISILSLSLYFVYFLFHAQHSFHIQF